jgi:hypothetical protein
MIAHTNGSGPHPHGRVASGLGAYPRSTASVLDTDRLMLLTPPRYEADPVSDEQLAAALTPGGARAGVVVVWEVRSDEGVPNLPLHRRAMLLGRPATVNLIVAHSYVRRDRSGRGPPTMRERLRAFWPGLLVSGPLKGHTAEIRMGLAHPPRDLAPRIVGLLLRRGLVMDACVQHLACGILARQLGEPADPPVSLRYAMDEGEMERAFEDAGVPEPDRWVRLGRGIRFVIASCGGAVDEQLAARHAGGREAESFRADLHALTGIEPVELVLRLGWRWVLEAWIQREVVRGGVSEDQAYRIEALDGPDGAGAIAGSGECAGVV